MADLNTVALIGRLTKNGELKYTNGAEPMAILNFSIAVNRRKRSGNENEKADFFEVSLFGKAGETLTQYMVKGKQVAIKGRLQQDRWTSQDGQSRNKIIVVAEEVILLGGGNSNNSNNDMNYNADAGWNSYN